MLKTDNFSYRVKFTVEILVNREQEYIRRKKKDEPEYGYSEFDDCDFVDAKRWISDTVTSFYEKDIDEIYEILGFNFHNNRLKTNPLIEDGRFYWFDNNCLVDGERLLHRGRLDIEYTCDVEVTDADLERMAQYESR